MIYKELQTSETTKVSRLLTLSIVAIASLLMFGLAYTADAQVVSSQMRLGSRGAQVSALQTFLAGNPSIYPEGLVTGYYGNLTAAAVRRFQAAYGIPQVGNVGPMTLAKINSLGSIGSGGVGTGVDVTAPRILPITVMASTSPSTIMFNTDTNAQATLYYSTSPIQLVEAQTNAAPSIVGNVSSQVQTEGGYGLNHTFSLPNLATSTNYYYFVQAVDQAGNVSISWPTTFMRGNL